MHLINEGEGIPSGLVAKNMNSLEFIWIQIRIIAPSRVINSQISWNNLIRRQKEGLQTL